ncbi:hypothetical protein LSTR_LSTR006955 [Laodelphax striatellus]|uniref:CUB domain-containing protein n=1 Tax=Laodelphax striatellus TaxID=195883 RepID=A0A482WMN7_LAOST|nr:hypothetical protein LSTR_LSTR006955 [Laodelphax striatellus]
MLKYFIVLFALNFGHDFKRISSLAWPSPAASLSRIAKVLNFFPVPVSDECLASDGRRTGVCLNAYECRIQSGNPMGQCALGFGVCCVFIASCDAEISNNVTYFVSPEFPGLTKTAQPCSIKVKKIAPEISQIRLDFVHFNLAQPNRRTGVCESDIFSILGGTSIGLKLCGQNSGQHIYYDVESATEPISILMNLTSNNLYRMWEIRISQIVFNQQAPAGCTQYHHGINGVIQTMNYAVNGRHLADQDYLVCMRQEHNMCSIVYEPCDENSFRIGPPVAGLLADDPGGSGDGPFPPILASPAQTYTSRPNGLDQTRQCNDRVLMPCDSEEFLNPAGGPSSCDLLHCGNTFCTAGEYPCRIESSIRPFNIRIQFGPGVQNENPDDNLGMCLKYQQQPCTT